MSLKLWFNGASAEEHPATHTLLQPGVNTFDPATAIELKRVLGDRVRLATPAEVARAEAAARAAERASIASAERAAQEHLAEELGAALEREAARDAAATELGILDERDEVVEVPVEVAAVAAVAEEEE